MGSKAEIWLFFIFVPIEITNISQNIRWKRFSLNRWLWNTQISIFHSAERQVKNIIIDGFGKTVKIHFRKIDGYR